MRLSELAEKEHAALVLNRALSRGRLHHAYLICASEVAPAEQLVRTFFAALNCDPENGLDCCETCPSCQAILDDQRDYPELMVFDALQQKLGIAEIRTIEERLSHYINQGRARAVLVRGMHQLTTEAQNCLLKIVEEPPANSYFFFITSNINGVLLTIRSRCQILRLNPGPLSVEQIISNQGYDTNDDKELGIAAICQNLLLAATKNIEAVMEACQNIPEERNKAAATLDLIELRLRDILAARLGLKESPYCYDPLWISQNETQFSVISTKRLLGAEDLLAKGRRYRENNVNQRLLGESVLLSMVNTEAR